MQEASKERIEQIKKNRRKKKIIGLLLLIVLGYMLFSNLDLGDLPWVGMTIKGPSKTCTEVRGPQTMTDTEVRDLEVMDMGFRADRNENRATITVANIDNVTGDVRVTLYCRNGNQQGELNKELDPGDEEIFTFLDVSDCELEYIIEPEIIKTRVERTAYVTDTVCE